MARFEVLTRDQQRIARIQLTNESAHVEAGAIHELRGDLEIVPQGAGASALGRAMAGQTVVRNVVRGSGELFLGPPTFGELAVLTLRGEGWILDHGAYVASVGDVTVGFVRNGARAAVRGGEGWIQSTVRGQGEVLVRAPGRLERVDLDDDELVVDGNFAVARTDDLHYTVRRLGGVVGGFTSGEGVVQVYRGTGSVLLAPIANLWEAIQAARQPSRKKKRGGSSGRRWADLLGEAMDLS